MAFSGALAAFAGLSMVLSLAAPTSSAPPPTPPTYAGGAGGPGATPRSGVTSYKYAAVGTQHLRYAARGGSATFTVHHPRQVWNGDHSLTEIAVRAPGSSFSYVEAGWIVNPGEPTRLFIFWWRDGQGHCYDFGCGFVSKGPGLKPGARLTVGTRIRLTWAHRNHRWWLVVNGRRSGYYPDNLWDGTFTRTKWFQVFGEIAHQPDQSLCEDMGTGRTPWQLRSGRVGRVSFVDGPNVHLSRQVAAPADNYGLRLTSQNSFRYGGPGHC
jgi:hypothetical protein